MDDRFRFKAIGVQTKEVIYVDCLYWFEENGIHGIEDGIGKGPYEHYHILQCTGLRDKNGRLIYEGDLLKDDKQQIGKVFYQTSSARFVINWRMLDGSFETDDCFGYGVVIGNIHENSELLEDQK
ncbi:MAG: hypothetical protein J6J74_06040 [Elusimicrobiaceae bacterium]|nr:hypothetical protein [Elusimicrobiaceae bacterium]